MGQGDGNALAPHCILRVAGGNDRIHSRHVCFHRCRIAIYLGDSLLARLVHVLLIAVVVVVFVGKGDGNALAPHCILGIAGGNGRVNGISLRVLVIGGSRRCNCRGALALNCHCIGFLLVYGDWIFVVDVIREVSMVPALRHRR